MGPDSQVLRALAGVSLDYPCAGPARSAGTPAPSAATMPATCALLEAGIRDGLYPGAQLCVAVRGRQHALVAIGAARSGVAMTGATLLPWFCCVKPIIAFAFGQLWERGLVDLDAPVSCVIPEFGRFGKGRITFRHVLTHTAGFPCDPVKAIRFEPRHQVLAAICDTPVASSARPGRFVKYWALWGWTLLAEAIRRLTGTEYDRYIQRHMLDRAGPVDLWLRMSAADVAERLDQVGLMFGLDGPRPYPWPTRCRLDQYDRDQPGASVMASAQGMVTVFEAMRLNGLTRPTTTEALTARHRVGLHDEDFGGYVSFGLGMVADGSYFGRHCSPRSYGHKGLRSSCIMVDPEHELVLGFVVNGMVRSGVSDDRDRALTEAVYHDLGLDGAEPPPRVTEVRAEPASRFPREPGGGR